MTRVGAALAVTVIVAACGQPWPEPPAIDDERYRVEYEMWRQQRQQTAEYALRVAGIWPVPQGEMPFGNGAGVLRRTGDRVTATPAPGSTMTFAGGGPVPPDSELALYETTLALGSLRFQIHDMGDESPRRLYLTAFDQTQPAEIAPIEAYPVDRRWRVAARFDAFATPRPVVVPDVRGGQMRFDAVGQLVFRLGDAEQRLTAFGEPGQEQLFVMFRDPTNATTTYAGYRILTPAVVKPGEWTVLDFNLALNPPCAYSKFTTCPLPPPENRLETAVDAGEQRHPSAQGWSG